MVDVNLTKALYNGYTVRSDGVVLNPKGKQVGWQRDDGYVFVFIKKERWRLHRLMWHTLVQPLGDDTIIDHADGNPANNNLSNLRACSRSENQYNRRAKKGNTAGGLKGVYRRDTKSGPRYIASYTNKGGGGDLYWHIPHPRGSSCGIPLSNGGYAWRVLGFK